MYRNKVKYLKLILKIDHINHNLISRIFKEKKKYKKYKMYNQISNIYNKDFMIIDHRELIIWYLKYIEIINNL